MQGTERMDRQLLDAGALAGPLVPAGSMFAFLAAHRRELFGDEDFAGLFPSGWGRPSVPASVMSSVMVQEVPAQCGTGHLPGRQPRRPAAQAPLPRHRPQQRLAEEPHRRT